MKQPHPADLLGHIMPHSSQSFTSANYFKRGNGWERPPHSHEELQFLAVTAGSLCIHLTEETQLLLPGDASLISPGTLHALSTQSGYEQLGANVLLGDEQALSGVIGLLKAHVRSPITVRCQQIAAQAPALLQLLITAQVFLSNSTLPMAMIAEKIGFEDSSNFSAFFCKKTGLSPSAYRKRKQ